MGIKKFGSKLLLCSIASALLSTAHAAILDPMGDQFQVSQSTVGFPLNSDFALAAREGPVPLNDEVARMVQETVCHGAVHVIRSVQSRDLLGCQRLPLAFQSGQAAS